MRQVQVRPGVVVVTPWYNITEASSHCGLDCSTFQQEATEGGLPCKCDANNKRYQVGGPCEFCC